MKNLFEGIFKSIKILTVFCFIAVFIFILKNLELKGNLPEWWEEYSKEDKLIACESLGESLNYNSGYSNIKVEGFLEEKMASLCDSEFGTKYTKVYKRYAIPIPKENKYLSAENIVKKVEELKPSISKFKNDLNILPYNGDSILLDDCKDVFGGVKCKNLKWKGPYYKGLLTSKLDSGLINDDFYIVREFYDKNGVILNERYNNLENLNKDVYSNIEDYNYGCVLDDVSKEGESSWLVFDVNQLLYSELKKITKDRYKMCLFLDGSRAGILMEVLEKSVDE